MPSDPLPHGMDVVQCSTHSHDYIIRGEGGGSPKGTFMSCIAGGGGDTLRLIVISQPNPGNHLLSRSHRN